MRCVVERLLLVEVFGMALRSTLCCIGVKMLNRKDIGHSEARPGIFHCGGRSVPLVQKSVGDYRRNHPRTLTPNHCRVPIEISNVDGDTRKRLKDLVNIQDQCSQDMVPEMQCKLYLDSRFARQLYICLAVNIAMVRIKMLSSFTKFAPPMLTIYPQ